MIFKVSIDKEKIREIGASTTPDLILFYCATNCYPSLHAAPMLFLRPPKKKKRSCLLEAIACPKSECIMHPKSKSIMCPKSKFISCSASQVG